MVDYMMLHDMARAWDVSIDQLLKMIGRDPALRRLGKYFGRSRVFRPEEVLLIREKLDARKKPAVA